ncbi:hypothetical protein pipiens_012044 [Culex pipiens pipiens]|uniref:Uncharacterized protein n=1 Tax=Culex pipiens pipiens TaxID=38569 RepID=A0ABD1D3W6_CULPP
MEPEIVVQRSIIQDEDLLHIEVITKDEGAWPRTTRYAGVNNSNNFTTRKWTSAWLEVVKWNPIRSNANAKRVNRPSVNNCHHSVGRGPRRVKDCRNWTPRPRTVSSCDARRTSEGRWNASRPRPGSCRNWKRPNDFEEDDRFSSGRESSSNMSGCGLEKIR